MSLELMPPREPGPPRVRKERERKPIQNTLTIYTGSRREMVRRWYSGELVRALTAVDKYWKPGYDDLSQLATSGSSSSARLFGPGRAPLEFEPDYFTLRYRAHGAIIGAADGMFHVPAQQLVLRDEDFFKALLNLRADGLCCQQCAEEGVIYRQHTGYLINDNEDGYVEDGDGNILRERCVLNEMLRLPFMTYLWVTQVDAVVKASRVPEEYARAALILFDHASYYEAGLPWRRPVYAIEEPKRRRRKLTKKPT